MHITKMNLITFENKKSLYIVTYHRGTCQQMGSFDSSANPVPNIKVLQFWFLFSYFYVQFHKLLKVHVSVDPWYSSAIQVIFCLFEQDIILLKRIKISHIFNSI